MNRTLVHGRFAIAFERVRRATYPVWDPCTMVEPGGRRWGGVRLRLPRTDLSVTFGVEGHRTFPQLRSPRWWWRQLTWRLRGRPSGPMGTNYTEDGS